MHMDRNAKTVSQLKAEDLRTVIYQALEHIMLERIYG